MLLFTTPSEDDWDQEADVIQREEIEELLNIEAAGELFPSERTLLRDVYRVGPRAAASHRGDNTPQNWYGPAPRPGQTVAAPAPSFVV